jgi:acetyl/propionyl-CoA carboxylase alpha subunit
MKPPWRLFRAKQSDLQPSVLSGPKLNATRLFLHSPSPWNAAIGTLSPERYIRNAHHIVVQVFGFGNGEAIHLYERECSIQRRFQKIVEESPSPGIDPDVRARMTEAALALTRSVRYRGAGTIEFVLDGDSGDFFFLEMNTRIQVEHPVTEAVMGVDLVLMQLELAAGTLDHGALKQADFLPKGHAIEVRVYAENPERMFMPWPGKMPVFVLPHDEPGVRVETGLRAGDTVTAHFDPMIAKIIGTGATRDEAIATIGTALSKTDFGSSITNLKFLSRLVEHDAFRKGQTFTTFVASHKEDLGI